MPRKVKFGFILGKDPKDLDSYKPLSFGYLKSYVEKYGNLNIEMLYIEDKCKIDNSFDIIGISSTSQDYCEAVEIADYTKEVDPNIIVLIGGHHITNLNGALIENMDIGFIGESEDTFLEFMTYYSEAAKLDFNELKKIDGIIFHEKNGSFNSIFCTKRRELIRPLDRIPIPDRSYVKDIYLFTSRGCPFKCSFCASSQFWQKVRYFSPEYIIEELKMIRKQFPTIKHLFYYDDLFVANRKRLRKFVSLLKDNKLNQEFTCQLSVKADLVDDEMCELLKSMNVVRVGFGAESASDRIYSFLKSGIGSPEANQNALDKLKEYDISAEVSLIVGSPSETEEDVHKTYHFAIENLIGKKLNRAFINLLSPMPGTQIWEYAIQRGLVSAEMDWRRLRGFSDKENSADKSLDGFIRRRMENKTIYLAEDTLPVRRLYVLMRFYELVIQEIIAKREIEQLASRNLERIDDENTQQTKQLQKDFNKAQQINITLIVQKLMRYPCIVKIGLLVLRGLEKFYLLLKRMK